MTILDHSKIRKDVRKITDRVNAFQAMGAATFVSLEENKGCNLNEYMKKLSDGNKDWFEKLASKDYSINDSSRFLNEEDIVFLAKLFRHSLDHYSNEILKKFPLPHDTKIESVSLDGVSAEWQIPPEVNDDRVLLYFHGGGNVLGSPKYTRLLSSEIAHLTRVKVLSVDYRLAPEYPFPAALEDCVKSYKWLLKEGYLPQNIIIGGDSAGGNLTICTLLKLREERIELPTGAIALSPVLDFTLESQTIYTNAETDPILAEVGVYWWYFAHLKNMDPYNPFISPVHADLKGLPPILVQVSTTEMLYDHSTRFVERAKAAGVDATLQEWDDMMHVWQNYGIYRLPESKEAIKKIGEFINNLLN